MDFLIVETAVMTFLRADSDKAKALLASQGQDPSGEHGVWGQKAQAIAEWLLAQGMTFRAGQLADLDAVTA